MASKAPIVAPAQDSRIPDPNIAPAHVFRIDIPAPGMFIIRKRRDKPETRPLQVTYALTAVRPQTPILMDPMGVELGRGRGPGRRIGLCRPAVPFPRPDPAALENGLVT